MNTFKMKRHNRLYLLVLLLVSISLQCVYGSVKTQRVDNTPPGAEEFNGQILAQIKKMRLQRGDQYKPRTKHLSTDGSAKYTNRLFLQSSPYLLQHAHNPVNWYPWGDEAFSTAARLNRPIFLSVGYSTCHWCHVMEEESFEDLEIATFINENYIAIKVDREERPDIDAIYMAALHALGLNGGWPMNVWLTPQKEPFYGGTYFPARDGDRGANMGLLTLLTKLKLIYEVQPQEIVSASQSLVGAIKASLIPVAGSKIPDPQILNLAAAYYKQNFDIFNGGVGEAPKFPNTTPFQFLLRQYQRSGDKELLKIVNTTLNKMAGGGIYDQIGGGFHRYAIDNEWLVPHFEKMLYDNALLSVDYLEAYQLTKNENFKRITNEILQYIMREMTSQQAGFYSATDADSHNPDGETEEGYFFTWDAKDLLNLLGEENYSIFSEYYGVSQHGNFESRNILNTPKSLDEFCKTRQLDKNTVQSIISKSRSLLYKQRKKRPAPLRDEKIITAWNGLMISAFAKAGLILDNKEYINQAVSSAHFILNNLYKNGRLYRSFKDNVASHNAYLDDYTFLIAGLLDVYEATYDIQWIKKAIELDAVLEQQFEDKKSGGFYLTANDHEKLLSREKPSFDSAEPTGNSVQVLNLLRLSEFTSKQAYRTRAENTFKAFSPILNETPMALSKMLVALDFYFGSAREIIIITAENNKASATPFINALRDQFSPNRIISIMAEGKDLATQSNTIKIAEGKRAFKGKTTAYVCEQGACKLPTTDIEVFRRQIKTRNEL